MDAFPDDSTEWSDGDGDGVGDNSDLFPLDGTESYDWDLDGVGDNADSDDDSDGVLDAQDSCPRGSLGDVVGADGCISPGGGDDVDIWRLIGVLGGMSLIGLIIAIFGRKLEDGESNDLGDLFGSKSDSSLQRFDEYPGWLWDPEANDWVEDPDSSVTAGDAGASDGGELGLEHFKRGTLISEGGMGMVYRCTQTSNGRTHAWKEAVGSRFNPLEEVNQRLREEGEALMALNHPRIPSFVARGSHTNEEGQEVEVLVMQYIDVPSLKQELEYLFRRGVTDSLAAAQQVISQICDALEYMADQDPPMYHRDVKPDNIMVDPSHGAILIDFGLAKGVSAGTDISISRGLSEGWSPPERRDGVSGGFTDVFSLGQVLWHMLTGERPFHALSEEEIAESLVEKGHPAWVAGLIHSSAQRRDRRIQTVAEFRMRLENEGEMV